MKRSILALMVGAAWIPATAYAQAAAQGDPEPAAEEIVVTAQRYEQRAQDVPLSITAIGAKELAARGLTDLKDLEYSVPGLSTFEYGVGQTFVQLRGVANTIGASTVGIYFDETPIGLDTQGDAFAVRLLDMERVEVLRGPQATLYGQGSMGGTIRYIPAAPRLDAVGGSVEAEYSSTRYGDDNYKAIGVLNLPLSTDTLGLRLVAGYERIGGFIDNVVSGERNVNHADIYTLRGTLLARPNDRLSLSLLGLHQKSDQNNKDFGIGYETTALVPIPIKDRYTLIQAKMAYDLDWAELSASANYIHRRYSDSSDLSSYYVPILISALGLPPGFIERVGYPLTARYTIFGGEVRLSSQGEGPFGWQLGATYRDLENNSGATTFTAPGTLPVDLLDFTSYARNKSYALYGEASYDFTPALKAIVGLRYFSESKRQVLANSVFGASALDRNNGKFDTLNPRFNLSYALSDRSMVYVNIAKGFRSGGFNATSAGGGVYTIPPTYEPDEIWSYEVGTKHQLLGNRLVLDASLYRSEWSKVQSYAFAPGSPISTVMNSGHVSGWGVDLSVIARPARALTLTATYGWNNLKFDRATLDKIKGDPVDGAVRSSYSASVDYRPALGGDVTGIFRADYQHAGRAQITIRNFITPIILPRPSRDLVNLRIGAAMGRFELTAFANNLFDENAPSLIGPYGALFENIEQRPRVIGVSANMRF